LTYKNIRHIHFSRICSGSLSVLAVIFFMFNASYSISNDIFSSGEILVYNVSYIGIDIGRVEVKSVGNDQINGINTYKTITNINTYPEIPFIDFRVIYREWMDRSLHYSHKFVTNTFYEKDDWGYGEMNFDYNKQYLNIKSWRHNEIEWEKHFKSDKKYCNGLTIIFLIRKYAHERKSIKVPAILNNDTTSAWINLSGEKEDIYVNALGKNVSCYKAAGRIEMTGLYGLAGDFNVWITADNARIPVQAKVNIILGSAFIELLEVKRD